MTSIDEVVNLKECHSSVVNSCLYIVIRMFKYLCQ